MHFSRLLAAVSVATLMAFPAMAQQTPAWLVELDPAKGELVEGIATIGDDIYLGMSQLWAIYKVEDGAAVPFATLPNPGAGAVIGLQVGPDGQLYTLVTSFNPEFTSGVYRVGPEGGEAELFAELTGTAFPIDLAFDEAGTLFVSDAATGTIHKIAADGTMAPFLSGTELLGGAGSCREGGQMTIGANGLAFKDGALFITNSDFGTVLKVPVTDGVAGTPEVFAGPDCTNIVGADGLVAVDGGFLATTAAAGKIIRIGDDGTVTVLAEGGELDFPAGVATLPDGTIVVTSAGFGGMATGNARPGVVTLTP